jgi:hypothetical protein
LPLAASGGGALDIAAGRTRLLANFAGWFSGLFFNLALPVAITSAILRYKLWDIDLILWRTLVYAALTGLLALVYFWIVVLRQSIFNRASEQ